MADVAEIQLMKVSAFTVGSSVYKGIRSLRLRRSPLRTYPVRLEGALRPTKLEQIETDEPPVTFEIAGASAAIDALVDTAAATCTVSGRDVVGGTDKTITITNPTFEGVDLGAQNRSVDGATLRGSATAFSIA
jgi:hypothetical protein